MLCCVLFLLLLHTPLSLSRGLPCNPQVMDRAASSLHGLLASQRVAGNNTARVVQIFRQVVEQVGMLHTSANLLHFGEELS